MEELFVIKYSYLIPLLPLLGACVAGFFGARWLKGQSHWPIWIGVGASAVLSFMLLFGMLAHMPHHDDGGGAGDAAHAGAEHGAAPAHLQSAQLGVAKNFFNWITAGTPPDPANPAHDKYFNAEAGFWFDPLTAVM